MSTIRELADEGTRRIRQPTWGNGEYVVLDGEWAAINAPGRRAMPVLTRQLPQDGWERYGNQEPVQQPDVEDDDGS